MTQPKHIDIMRQIDRSPFRDGRRQLPQSKWAELMRAIAEDIEADALDEAGKNRVLLAIGRAAVEMDRNEKNLKEMQKEVSRLRGKPLREKTPREPQD